MTKIKKMKLLPSDFRKKWIIIFFSTFVLGIFLVLFVSGYESYKEDMSEMEKKHDNAVLLLKEKVRQSIVRKHNSDLIGKNMENLYVNFPYIGNLVIYNKDGKAIYERNKKIASSFHHEGLPNEKNQLRKPLKGFYNKHWHYGVPIYVDTSSSLFPAESSKEKKYVGSLYFVVDGSSVLSNVMDQYAISSLYVGFIIVAIYVILRLFLNKMSSPILRISQLMDKASSGEREINVRTNSKVKEVRTIQQSFKKLLDEVVLREKELEKSRDEALDFAKKKTEFTANISHEIKTPLNGIMGMLDSIEDENMSETTKDSIKIARESSDLLMNLVEDILSYSKLDSGNYSFYNEEIDLENIVNDTLLLQSKSYYGKDLSINGVFSKDLPKKFVSDKYKIKQLLNNLISNASKFTEDGYVYVDVSLLDERKEGNVQDVKIDVIDSGVGIAEEDYKSIFEPYSQKDNSMSRKYNGTGLGLAICKKIVKAMNGSISVESKKGKGSKFSITLPLEVAKEQVQYSGPLAGKRIMAYVESVDTEKVLDSLSEYSRMFIEYSSSLEVFEDKLKNEDYDVIFTSVQDNKLEMEELLIDLKRHGYIQNKKIFNIKPFFVDKLYGADFDLNSPLLKSSFLQKLSSVFKGDLHSNIVSLESFKSSGSPIENEVSKSFNERILVVEDNKINMKVAKKVLNKIGFKNIDCAENGNVGLEMYMTNKYDLVLMDCQMPVMDGYEATKKIREYEKERSFKNCPIIALTANSGESEKGLCFKSGMNEFLPKPVKRESVAEKIKLVLSGDRTAQNTLLI